VRLTARVPNPPPELLPPPPPPPHAEMKSKNNAENVRICDFANFINNTPLFLDK
jgi:hypothetical protein